MALFLRRFGPLPFTPFLLVLAPSASPAWGPHTEITAAALAALPGRARVEKQFGPDWKRLAADYVWTPDWQEAVRPDHYAEDYLLFPGSPAHHSHMHPGVRAAYAPFFRRALQALRTETPANAARWLGSLLHFVQDAGSPPHTTGIGGELHSRMERWVDEAKVALPGYAPRLLGKTDDDALKGFLARMDALAAYAKVRALKLKPLVEKLDKRANQPLELECALECARVSADVLHTLFALGLAKPAEAGAGLEGKLDYRPPAGYATVPAKVVLAGTHFSTTTDAAGAYAFRDLPPGRYTVWVLATGYATVEVKGVTLKAGATTKLSPKLTPDRVPGNLVRNPDFRLRWVRPGRPDGWAPDPARGGRWASAVVRVPLEAKCAVRVEFLPGKSAPVAVRWCTNPASTAGSREVALPAAAGGTVTAEVTPDKLLKPFEKGVLFLEVLVQSKGPPGDVCRHVAVTFAGKPR